MMAKKLSESFQYDTRIQKRGAIMKDIEQRARFDDFELEDHYDFSDGIRGRFYVLRKKACDLGAYERLQNVTLPNDMIAVMNFLSAQVANGSIIGIGNPSVAAGKLDALKNQLYLPPCMASTIK